MERPTEQAGEVQAETGEVLILGLGHVSDHICLDASCFLAEALADPVLCPRSGDNEVVLVERQEIQVVQINRILKRKEWAETGERRQRLVDRS